jgi:diguanylate cyclase (GGDEF)-like protein
MESIRKDVLKCLYDLTDDDDKLIYELNRMIKKGGAQVCQVIFHVLTHLDMDLKKAEDCWHEIVAHREIMEDCLGRKVNLRTAICDYFGSINKSLKNPIVVEIHIFESKTNISKYDYLTGLYTRGSFEGSLVRELARSKRHETETSLLFFDLDDFKKVNDAFGHLAGDVALKHVAGVILKQVRAKDIAARYGGEEVAVILPETGKPEALMVAERIREKVEKCPFDFMGTAVKLTVSCGVASFPIDANESSKLIKCADDALYRAKSYGKNNVVLYSHDKRRYFRLDFNTDIKVKKIDAKADTTLKGTSKNISVNGLLFETTEPIDLGTKVELHVPLNASHEPLIIIGTVVRVEFFEAGRYDIGVSFIEMDRSTKNEISQYLVKQLRQIALS